MAEGAATINRAGRTDREAFDSVLSGSGAEIRQLAHAVRDLVFEVQSFGR